MLQVTKRVKVPTGLKCNMKCRFCYYWNYLDAENPPTKHIKYLLELCKKHGIRDIDFEGGESTIRKDFPELVSYAKELGFRSICVITNGIMMAQKDYTKKLIEAGLNDVLFSVHGHNQKMHDYLTQIPGAFKKITQAIENVKKFEIRCRINSVIVSPNYKYMAQLAKLLLKIKPDAVNFISFNDWCSAYMKIREMSCKYSEVGPEMKKAIDILDPVIKKITVRYIPFCFMQGYEKYVCNLLQKKWDPDEWSEGIKDRLVSGRWRHYYHIARGLIFNHPFSNGYKFKDIVDTIILNQMREGYAKSEECKKCKFNLICDGVEKTYAQVIGVHELKAVLGKQILDPMYFRKEYSN